MNKIKILLLGKGTSIAYALITLALAMVPEDCYKHIRLNNDWPDGVVLLVNRIILCVFLFVVVKLIYGCYRKHRKKVIITGNIYTIQIEYGDILQIKDGKKIINFDECFTTKVGEAPGDIKEDSLCGQSLKRQENLNVRKLIKASGIQPLETKSQYKNQTRYEPGVIVPNGDDLLMAFAKLDKDGRDT